VDKVQYYLANIEARQMIAAAGYKRVLEEHTFRRRIADMLRIISESSGGRPASQATSS
jgi:spore maturation protein CgeB